NILANSFFFSSRRRHTRSKRDWSSDVCSSDLYRNLQPVRESCHFRNRCNIRPFFQFNFSCFFRRQWCIQKKQLKLNWKKGDRKSTRLNSSHVSISYAVFCLKKKKILNRMTTET